MAKELKNLNYRFLQEKMALREELNLLVKKEEMPKIRKNPRKNQCAEECFYRIFDLIVKVFIPVKHSIIIIV